MKTVSATEARRSWFRLLDEVVEGENVVIDREGVQVELRRSDRGDRPEPPDYSRVLRLTGDDNANEWGWEWDPDSGEAHPRDNDEP